MSFIFKTSDIFRVGVIKRSFTNNTLLARKVYTSGSFCNDVLFTNNKFVLYFISKLRKKKLIIEYSG